MGEISEKKGRSPSIRNKLIRTQNTASPANTDKRPPDIPEDAALSPDQITPKRSHTPGHLASKSHDKRNRKGSDVGVRQRSASLSQKEMPSTPSPTPPRPANAAPPLGFGYGTLIGHGKAQLAPAISQALPHIPTALPVAEPERAKQPLNMRSTSAIAPRQANHANTATPAPEAAAASSNLTRTAAAHSNVRQIHPGHIAFPPLPTPRTAPDVAPAPASGMYWSRAPLSGNPRTPIRAHTATLIGSNIYMFGGCDSRTCFNELSVLDTDSFYLSSPHVVGEMPEALRAMTCTAVGKKLVVFGGGDGPAYYNDVYVLDTQNFRWHKPRISGEAAPSKRRAHTACFYKSGIYIFGGGDGVRALNDVWRLDVSDTRNMSWKLISAPTAASSSGDDSPHETKPRARGYHTANMVGSKLIIFGGSDGGECFRDVWIFDVETQAFASVHIPISYPRLSHTATIVGSYLFVIGGHDGVEYSDEVLLLNLVTMNWDRRKVYGERLQPRGYHGSVLSDSRLVVTGGFDGSEVFGDVWVLELAVHAYYSQISHFSIDV